MYEYTNVTKELFEIVKRNVREFLENNGTPNPNIGQIELQAARILGYSNHHQIKDVLNIKNLDFIDFSHLTDEDIVELIKTNPKIELDIENSSLKEWSLQDIIDSINKFIDFPQKRLNKKLNNLLLEFYNENSSV